MRETHSPKEFLAARAVHQQRPDYRALPLVVSGLGPKTRIAAP